MIIQKPTETFENSNHNHQDSANGGTISNITGNAATVTGLSVTAGKTLTVSKTMTLTASADAAVITLPNATVTFAAPGSSGNVMTSDGTDWTSAPAPAGMDILGVQIFT